MLNCEPVHTAFPLHQDRTGPLSERSLSAASLAACSSARFFSDSSHRLRLFKFLRSVRAASASLSACVTSSRGCSRCFCRSFFSRCSLYFADRISSSISLTLVVLVCICVCARLDCLTVPPSAGSQDVLSFFFEGFFGCTDCWGRFGSIFTFFRNADPDVRASSAFRFLAFSAFSCLANTLSPSRSSPAVF